MSAKQKRIPEPLSPAELDRTYRLANGRQITGHELSQAHRVLGPEAWALVVQSFRRGTPFVKKLAASRLIETVLAAADRPDAPGESGA